MAFDSESETESETETEPETFPISHFPALCLCVYVMLYMLSRQIGCDWLKCAPHGPHPGRHPRDCYLDSSFSEARFLVSGFWLVSGLWSLVSRGKPLRVSKGKPLTASTLPSQGPTPPPSILHCTAGKIGFNGRFSIENIERLKKIDSGMFYK